MAELIAIIDNSADFAPVGWQPIAGGNELVNTGGYLVNVSGPGIVALGSSSASNGIEDQGHDGGTDGDGDHDLNNGEAAAICSSHLS